ncbi:MAG: flagellar hook-basal body complex protein FliE [Rhizomicrobium sp.]
MAVLPAAAAAAYQAISNNRRCRRRRRRDLARRDRRGRERFHQLPAGRAQGRHGHDEAGRDHAARQVAGQANIVDVVNAVNQAEITLDTVVAVRDKVVAAYQSIMNMPI